MKRFFLPILLVLSLAALSTLAACLPEPTPLPPEPTATPLPPTLTPTATTVWFPPTPTYTPFPTQPVTPTVDVKPRIGSLVVSDAFDDPDLWTLGKYPQGSIALSKHQLTLAVSQAGGYLSTLRRQTSLQDFYVELTASPSMCRGEDEYGLLLRASEDNFYRFSLACNGQARLDRFYNGQASSPQGWEWSPAIPPGAPSISQLAVRARGKEMRFYVNDQYLFTVNDGTLPNGSLGLFARAASDTPVTVNFSDLKVYEP